MSECGELDDGVGGSVEAGNTYTDDFTGGELLASSRDFRSEDMIVARLLKSLVHIATLQTDWKLMCQGIGFQDSWERAVPAVHSERSLSESLGGFLLSSEFDGCEVEAFIFI